jgi:transposase-like protein
MGTNKERRRHRSWPEALKREIVAATLTPGSSVSVVARRYDVNANQVFAWRRRYRAGSAEPTALQLMPLTSLREKLIKIGAKVVSHGRYVTFQMAEVAVPRQMFADILSLIARLRAQPAPA